MSPSVEGSGPYAKADILPAELHDYMESGTGRQLGMPAHAFVGRDVQRARHGKRSGYRWIRWAGGYVAGGYVP